MIRIVVKAKFRGEDTNILKIFLGENPAFTIKYEKFVWSDLSPKDDQNRGEDTKISKIFLGRTPLRQNNQSQYNTFHNLTKFKSMKWQKLIAIFSRAWSIF